MPDYSKRPSDIFIEGGWRRPHNDLREQKVGGGHKAIHDDGTAAKFGFGAAPIHGTVHWSQFLPLLLEIFGPSWFETGSISVHFVTPVSHLQPVKAFMSKPESSKMPQQVDVWMEHMDGRIVLQGTASVDAAQVGVPRMVQTKMASIKPVKGNLLFVRHPVGTKSLNVEKAVIEFDKQIGPMFPFTLSRKLEIITEFHPWFTEIGGKESPWGRAILPPEALNQLMLGLAGDMTPAKWPALPQDKWITDAAAGRTPVGLFGGCEVVLHAGPVFPGKVYHVTRKLVGKGEIPRAEFRWVRTLLSDPDDGKLIAEMTLQEVMLKGSFEGYDELRKRSDAAGLDSKL